MQKWVNGLLGLEDESLESHSPFTAHATSNLEKLLVLSQTLGGRRDVDESLQYLLGAIAQAFSFSCGVLLETPQKDFLEVRSHRGFSASLVKNFRVGSSEGPIGWCHSTAQKSVLFLDEAKELPPVYARFAAEGWRSLFVAPLVVEGENYGVFIAGSSRARDFAQEELERLDPYIKILSLSLRNTRLLEQVENFNHRLEKEISATTQELTRTNARLIHRVRQLKALYEITLAAGSNASFAELLKTVTARLGDLFSLEWAMFFVCDPRNLQAWQLTVQSVSSSLLGHCEANHAVAVRLNNPDWQTLPRPIASVREAFNSGEMQFFHSDSVVATALFPPEVLKDLPAPFQRLICRSCVAVPLKTSERTWGVMALFNLQSLSQTLEESTASLKYNPQLSEEDKETLLLVGSRLAASIESTQVHSNLNQRLADLSTLQEINESIAPNPVLEFTLGRMAKILSRAMGCDTCAFMFYDPESGKVVFQEGAPEKKYAAETVLRREKEQAISSQTLREGKARIVSDVHSLEFPLSPAEITAKVQSLMFVPLKVEGREIGLLRLGSVSPHFFDDNHLNLARLIADRVAVILQNAQLYERVLVSNEELERLNRVKTEFVSIVSHELRTPVTAIKGFVDLVLGEEAGELNDQQKRFLQICHHSIDRLTLLISDLLDISRIESGKIKLHFAPVDLESIINAVVTQARQVTQKKRQNLTLVMDTPMPPVLADEKRLRQVVDNLLSNAVKFTSEGGNIHLQVEDLGDFILVSVQDNGVGIKKENHEKIFEKFYQVDSSLTRAVGGTGLGLAIAKTLVDMHGGRIWVESEVNRGSTFRFLLPRQKDKL